VSEPRDAKVHPDPFGSRTHDETADRALANALPQIVWTCDAQGELEWVNDRWFELTGLTEAETLVDKGPLVAVHPNDHAELARRWQHAIETSEPTEIEYRIRNTRGEYRWHLARVAPVRGANGEVTRWVAATFDMHDRHVAQDALRASERRLETVFHICPQPMTISRQSDGTFLDVNDAFLEMTGFTREEAIGKTSLELGLLSPENRAILIDWIVNMRSRHGLELPIRVKDGRIMRVLFSSARIEVDGVPCLVNVSTDVTDQRATEDILRDSEARARARADDVAALMDAVPAVVWISYDRDCREIYGNRAGHAVLRIPMGDNLSKTAIGSSSTEHFAVFVDGRKVSTDELPMQRAAQGEEFRNYEEELRFDDGEVTNLYGNIVPLRDPDGTPRGAIGAFLDVTRLKQAEDALRRADRRKDEFLALLSHELRNPLTPILTSARLLEHRVDPEARHDVDVIVRQVKHLVRLVDDLLDVSRVARGAVTLSMARLDLATVVARAVQSTAPLLEQRGHRLEISLPAGNLAVEGDEVRLTQIVDNLLSNAARYTPPGGTVSVSGAREDDSVVLRVRDTGVGIDPALLPELFDTFVQGVRSPDRAQGGLGIGLSLVRRLTELHGGSVTAHSDGPGLGSEFAVRLPAASGSAKRSGHDARLSPGRETSPRRLRVLLVDDHADVVDGLSRLLAVAGYDVRVSQDPLNAIALADAFRPHVAILDIGLPTMDGYALARELRSRSGGSPPVLIALSGYSQARDRQRSEASGFVVHLAKPVDIDELLNVLGKVTADRTAAAAYAS
jgi:PAS domain S-box-containing protein